MKLQTHEFASVACASWQQLCEATVLWPNSFPRKKVCERASLLHEKIFCAGCGAATHLYSLFFFQALD